MRKLVSLLTASAAVAGAVALGASAADNTRISGSYSFVAHSICVDPIRIAGSYDEMAHTFYDKAGNATRIAFTGKATVVYTDLTNGSTCSPNSSGPGTVDLASGQSDLRGGNGTIFDSSGHLIATDGRLVLDAGGNVISIVGHQTDVCTELGSSPAP